MKFSKHVAYCGGVSALMFSLGASAMQGQDQGQAQECGKDVISCNVDLSQEAPELVIGKDWETPLTRDVVRSAICKVKTSRVGSKTQIIKGILKFYTQENSTRAGAKTLTYEHNKVQTNDDSCQKQQVVVDQLLDLMNTEDFEAPQQDDTFRFLTAEGKAYDVKLANFTYETVEFTMTQVTSTEGPDCERNYVNEEAMSVLSDALSRARLVDFNQAQFVDSNFEDCARVKHAQKRVKKESSRRNK